MTLSLVTERQAVSTKSVSPAAARALRKDQRRRQRIHGARHLPYILIAPAALYLVLFQGFPLLQQFKLSISDTPLLNPNKFEYVGLDNFVGIFEDPGFMQTLIVTVAYVIACVVGIVSIGLGVALLMNRDFRGRGLVRSLIIIPWAAPSVAIALIFVWMLNGQYGIINDILGLVGLAPPGGVWLDNPTLALPTIIVITIWQLFPFTAVVILAALQAVPDELKEASTLDGANRRQQFRAVVWPVIAPTVGLMALLVTIWSIRRFELIWLMTQGGPIGTTNTLVVDLYRRGFINNELGESAAVGIVGLTISLLITIAYFIVSSRQERAKEAR
jgi:multiple sugar transport system permease protein